MPPRLRAQHRPEYQGTADAVRQNIDWLEQHPSRYVLVLPSDHVCRMDYGKLLEYHVLRGADLTIACSEMALQETQRFGVAELDLAERIAGKPDRPGGLPSRPGTTLASMEIYVFGTRALIDVLKADARCPCSSHDFGRDLIPRMVDGAGTVSAYDVQEQVSRDFYWRDIGTLDAYWAASMELLAPSSSLGDPDDSLPSPLRQLPDAQILQESGCSPRVTDSLLSPGVQVIGAQVHRSVLGREVTVDPRAEVSQSVLMGGVHVGPGARVHRAIVDEGVRIPAGVRIGGASADELSGDAGAVRVSPAGITVVPRGLPRLRCAPAWVGRASSGRDQATPSLRERGRALVASPAA